MRNALLLIFIVVSVATLAADRYVTVQFMEECQRENNHNTQELAYIKEVLSAQIRYERLVTVSSYLAEQNKELKDAGMNLFKAYQQELMLNLKLQSQLHKHGLEIPEKQGRNPDPET